MSRLLYPPSGGLHLPITRRGILRASAILAGAGLLSSRAIPVWAQDAYAEFEPLWKSAAFDWTRYSGTTLQIGALGHPWTEALTPLLPHFTRLTGIELQLTPQSETEYVAEMPVKLGAGNATPDVYMVWALGQAIEAGWLAPLDEMEANPEISDPAWYDAEDIFSSGRSFQKWTDGVTYTRAITAEAQTMFYNQPLMDAAGLAIPTTMEELYAAAVALKTDEVAGIALRSKATGDAAPWPAGGWVFSYGGSIIDPATGTVGLTSANSIAGIESYARILQEAGPIGIGNYHWMECLNDFMAGAAAIAGDSSTFAGDIGNPEKSTVAGLTTFGALPSAGGLPAKPNMWHWTAGINANSANKEAAFLFLSWATSKPTCALLAAAGLGTARASAWGTSAFGDRFGAQAASAALANLSAADGDLFKAAWFHPKGPQILDAFAIGINEAVTGTKDAATAMADVAAKLEGQL
jgi:multiple sugar transport system substrate-binding protein